MTDKLNNPFKISELVETVNNLVDTTYDDSVVVHKAGTETITGTKTFANSNNPQITIKNTQYAYSDTQSSNQYWGIQFNDKNNVRVAKVEPYFIGSGAVGINLSCSTQVSGSLKYGALTVSLDASGNPTTQAITPDTSDNSTKIATTAFVKAQGYITSYTDTKNTAGSTNTTSKIFLIGATSQAANPQTYSQDTVFVNTSGQLQTPTPGNDSNTTVAATTAFVKNVLKTSGAGLYTISKAANGYCKFNGGLIIQWISSTDSSTGDNVWTFGTAFSDTNYAALAIPTTGSSNTSDVYIKNKTKTNCTFSQHVVKNEAHCCIAIGY